MGASSRAQAFIGYKLERDWLFTKTYGFECEHVTGHSSMNFCPECGESQKEWEKPIEALGEDGAWSEELLCRFFRLN